MHVKLEVMNKASGKGSGLYRAILSVLWGAATCPSPPGRWWLVSGAGPRGQISPDIRRPTALHLRWGQDSRFEKCFVFKTGLLSVQYPHPNFEHYLTLWCINAESSVRKGCDEVAQLLGFFSFWKGVPSPRGLPALASVTESVLHPSQILFTNSVWIK